MPVQVAVQPLNSLQSLVGPGLEHIIPLADFNKEQERRYIEETIKFNGGVRENAAKMLGISMATLYRKIEVKKGAGKK